MVDKKEWPNKRHVGRKIIDQGKDWIQLDDGRKIYVEDPMELE